MAANLLGGMFGGLPEYNSMYFGLRFLYWLAIGLAARGEGAEVVVAPPFPGLRIDLGRIWA